MASSMEGFEHLEIQLEQIKSATNNFNEENIIGSGGFGKVYKGDLCHSHSKGKSMVALKRLDRKHGQGDAEFHKEVRMLSCYRHENIISLLGFCSGRDEMILVYEYASRGSLDGYLKDVNLTWTQRLKICLDAAKGLSYLHDPRETNQRLIHCDIKSANILLDENFNAKVSDFGLSKIGPANQHNSMLVTSALGTPGYCDPVFIDTYTLTKESDVYSFGVVLFEVLCGKLCVEYSKGQLKVIHVPMWKESYEEKKLDRIILEDIKQQMNRVSLETFSGIAYQCLKRLRKERPTMSLVVEKLEIALQMQVLPKEYIEIANASVDPLFCRSLEEFKKLLSKEVLLNEGKTWLSLNEMEELHVMVSIEEYLCLDDPNRDYSDRYSSKEKSRFAVGCYKTSLMEFKLRVTPPLFLSPHVTYGINLIFQCTNIEHLKLPSFPIRYKLQGETKMSFVYLADQREDGWLVAELYQFTSDGDKSILDLEIIFEKCWFLGTFHVEGIEFQPLGRVEHALVAVGYKDIHKATVTPLFYTSTEELKLLLARGIFLNGCKTWLSVNEKGEHIERIYIQACLNPDEDLLVDPADYGILNSRFPGGLCYEYRFPFEARVRGEYLTPHISYTLNLFFRYEYQSLVNSHNPLRYKIDGEAKVFIIYPSTLLREDGWFIVPFYHFTTQHTTADLQFQFEDRYAHLLVAGFEFQPSEEKVQLPVFEEYQHIVEAASQSLFYTSLDELKQILSKGIHLKDYKEWFSLNEKGQHCHMISMKDCLIPNQDSTPQTYKSDYRSRFPAGLYQTNNKGFTTHVKTHLLSPSLTYTVNLVFINYSYDKPLYIDLKYRLRGEATSYAVYLGNWRDDDGFLMAELYQFTSDGSIVDLEIIFEYSGTDIDKVEGILLQSLEIVEDPMLEDDKVEDTQTMEDPMLEDDKVEDTQTISDSGILKLSRDTKKWKMKKNLYSCLGKWFQFNKDTPQDTPQEWSYLDKNEKRCLMLSARASCLTWSEGQSTWCSLPKSRFGEVLVITGGYGFGIQGIIEPQDVSPETSYAAYLVFKLPQDQSTFEAPIQVEDENAPYSRRYSFIYLVSPPHTPVIGPKFDENTYNPLNRCKRNALPQQRTDGWMEVKVWQFKTKTTTESVPMNLLFSHPGEENLSGLMIQGIELRPI